MVGAAPVKGCLLILSFVLRFMNAGCSVVKIRYVTVSNYILIPYKSGRQSNCLSGASDGEKLEALSSGC